MTRRIVAGRVGILHGLRALLVAACLIAFSPGCAEQSPPGPPPSLDMYGPATNRHLSIGIFSGGHSIDRAQQFDQWFGRPATFNVEFVDYTVDCANVGAGWPVGQWMKDGQAARPNMMFSVPLGAAQLSKDPNVYGGQHRNMLAAVADGACDNDYRKLAAKMAAAYPKALVRIGWEFNGGWYIWQAAAKEADYVAAFRHVAAIFRAASPNFTIIWCPAAGDFPYHRQTVALSYPGDDVVDEIGIDAYDLSDKYTGGDDTIENALGHWGVFVNLPWSLNWLADFAGQHRKPIALPEWGTGAAVKNLHDGVITSTWILMMYRWVTTHNVRHVAYWNADAKSGYDASLFTHPMMGKAYLATFGKYKAR